jgi:hypothetical protein
LNTGTKGIKDHGFVYSESQDPRLEKSDFISLGETSRKGTYSAHVEMNIVQAKPYYVKAYAVIKENNRVVYGQLVEFIGE